MNSQIATGGTSASPPNVNLSSGGKDVVSSGCMHTFDKSNLTLRLDDLTFHFQFARDKEKQRLESEPKSEKSLFFKVFNFDSPLGTGLIDPILLGKYKKRQLYLIFTVYSIGEGGQKLFQYTLFSGEAVNE